MMAWNSTLNTKQERDTNSGFTPEYRPGYQQDIPFEEAV